MPRKLPPVLGVVLVFLRQRAGWGQEELARKHGITGPILSRYEKGKVPLTRARFDELVEPLGYSLAEVDRAVELGEELRPGAAAPRDAEQATAWALENAVAHIGREARGAAHSEVGRFLAEKKAEKERHQAGEDWALLSSRPNKDWPILIAGASAYQGWAFCERICAESERAAADQADRALDLARLAVRIAEAMPVDDHAKRARLRGYAEAHLANAWRVAGDLPTADRTYAVARTLWEEGRRAELPLDVSRVLDLGASLRRAQRRFSEALEMLDSALKLTTSNEGFCRIMLKKALTLEQSGDYEMAATVLHQASAAVEAQGDQRELFGMRFNLAVNMVHAGRLANAEELLSGIWELAGTLGNELDLWRCRWLDARIAGERGRIAEATASLEQVHSAFVGRKNLYDTALATLELAGLYLRKGRAYEARMLAQQTARALSLQGVAREALGALRLFFEAAEQEAGALTLALVRDLLRECASLKPQGLT